jgi:mitogen-activated protein kinase 7
MDSQQLPPAPVPTAAEQPGAGVGPAFSTDVNTAKDSEEHPGSALDRQLEGKI